MKHKNGKNEIISTEKTHPTKIKCTEMIRIPCYFCTSGQDAEPPASSKELTQSSESTSSF